MFEYDNCLLLFLYVAPGFVFNIQIFCNFKCVLNTVGPTCFKIFFLVILYCLVFVGFLYIVTKYDSHAGTSTEHCAAVKNCVIRFFILVCINKYKICTKVYCIQN